MKTSALIGCIILPLAIAWAEPSIAQIKLPVQPKWPSARGLPPNEREEIERRNEDALYNWLKGLTDDQQAAWHASVGRTERKKIKRIGEQSLPVKDSGYDWQADARLSGLAQSEIAQLEHDKLLFEDLAFKQSFSLYTEPRGPVFITSDSLLNAFHVLFEDSFRELEVRRALALKQQLENVLSKVRELLAGQRNSYPREELVAGWHRAQLVVGPALRLLGSKPDIFDAEVRDEIELQVTKIRAAELQELPAWLGPPSRTLLSLDYRRFKPIGFYTQTESLQNYFRAVRWLQSVPFRADHDDELTAIGLLGYGTGQLYRSHAPRFFENFAIFLGRPDDPGLGEAAYEFQNFLTAHGDRKSWREDLASKRIWLLRSDSELKGLRKLNDASRLPPRAEEKPAEIQFRVLSAYRVPDSLVLAKTAKPGQLPTGLAVATFLGSEFARHRLPAMDAAELDAALQSALEDWQPTDEERRRRRQSLYDDYLGVLAALCAPAEADAPGFMRSEPWAAKSCFTVLGSWAQMRHTFTLQAKENINYMGLVDVPPGFVEPNPEFFRRMADLTERTAQQLDNAGVFQRSRQAEAEELEGTATFLRSLKFHLPGATKADVARLSAEARKHYEQAIESFGRFHEEADSDADFQKFHRDVIASAEAQLDRIKAMTADEPYFSSTRERWDELKMMTRRLEALAHKQLRKQPWTKEEEQFIRNYGESLALVMGYFGNSWLTPRDDAPRWVTVASDPATDTLLAVATGRPRLLHVLYPWQGMEIHCTGAVMSYYEYAGKQRLSDEAWKATLDSKDAPPLPKWIEPYLAK